MEKEKKCEKKLIGNQEREREREIRGSKKRCFVSGVADRERKMRGGGQLQDKALTAINIFFFIGLFLNFENDLVGAGAAN